MDLQSVSDELYAASPDEFVERRKQRVAEARAERDRQLAKEIGQLRRPTRSAWIVNVLARESPHEIQGLLELGAALGEAQRQLSGPDLRRLSSQRSATLSALTKRAVEIAATHGHTASEASRQEVSQTLQAALGDPGIAELVRAGTLVQPATYGGFGPLGFGEPAELSGQQAEPAQSGEPPPSDQQTPGGSQTQTPPESQELIRAREAAEAAAAALRDALEAANTAEREAEEATAEADGLADQVETLRASLQQAETRERAAGDAARAARKRHQQLAEAVRAAEQAEVEAKQSLDSLTDA